MNALLIDPSTLNVIYYYDGTTSIAVSYLDNLSKLFSDCRALGTSFDIYLLMTPRFRGEGDMKIDDLKCGESEFFADSEELNRLIEVFSSIDTAGNVYLVNLLTAVIEGAKVSSFKACLNIGNRIGVLEVDKGYLTKVIVYNNKKELLETEDDSFETTVYSYADLFDVNKFSGMYHNIDISNLELSNLIPLIQCLHTETALDMRKLKPLVDSVIEENNKNLVVEDDSTVSPETTEEPERKVPKVSTNRKKGVKTKDNPPPKSPTTRKKKSNTSVRRVVSPLTVVCSLGLFMSGIVLGLGFWTLKYPEEAKKLSDNATEMAVRVANYEQLTAAYSVDNRISSNMYKAYEYLSGYTGSATLIGLEAFSDRYVSSMNFASDTEKDSFVVYLEERYIVTDVSPVTANTEGGSLEYLITFS